MHQALFSPPTHEPENEAAVLSAFAKPGDVDFPREKVLRLAKQHCCSLASQTFPFCSADRFQYAPRGGTESDRCCGTERVCMACETSIVGGDPLKDDW